MIGIESTSLTKSDIKRIKNQQVGGVILFNRNYQSKEQITLLCEQIHQIKRDIIIGVDQEGGRVQRLNDSDFTKLQSLYSIGKNYNNNKQETIKKITDHAKIMASELKACGIDLCFAPVIDLYDKNSPIIGERAFSDNPDTVITLSNYYIQAMHQVGIIPVIKHFPGHGQLHYDTHLETVTDSRSLNEIEKTDLKPFIYYLINSNIPVMASHILLPKVDQSITSFSSFWLKSYIKEKHQYHGLIFSDDLGMKAALNEAKKLKRSCISLALDNGCDIAIIGNNFNLIDEYLAF
ncbi:beta-N-acetylhexosaminidase [Thiotrichales bacterium 19S11-10]|nr:beta-N-acetylhexosaminidase [Thiotrichales bacterium 19S11-10]MCF6806886.1 beta-N-acetylhexosaminidase [Thiotrichales bacterium 19S9-11]MCF6810855.1 beta-N-acetylhexosaminidase [Thiotrichales bacterium 19S9-12]